MTLDQIARDLDTTQERLRKMTPSKDMKGDAILRAFIVSAFARGHPLDAIQDYVDRSETMVTHVIRFDCMTDNSASYSRSLSQIRAEMFLSERGQG
jgi:hypothetical protein